MSTTVKLDKISKEKLEKLQARLRLQANLKLDQYKILGSLIDFGEEKYSEFITLLKGIKLTDKEITEFHTQYIKKGVYLHPEKNDDELLYGE